MDKTLQVRLHHAGEFKKTVYVGGRSLLVPEVDVDIFSYSVLMEYLKDYLNYTEIGGIYINKGRMGGWKLLLNDEDINAFTEGCDNGEEVHFYIDNTVDKDIEPVTQMQPHVIIRPRKNIIQDYAKKPVKRNYTTTHLLQQQQKLMQRKSPRLAKSNTLSTVPDLINGKQDVSVKETGTARRKLNLEDKEDDEIDDDTEENEADVELPPPPVLTSYELGRIARMQENDAVCKKLGLPSLVSSMREGTSAIKNRKRKGKDPEGCDEYTPEIEHEDDSDDSSERIKSVKSKKPPPGPRTRSRANAPTEIQKEPTLAAKTVKQPKKAGTNREATSSYRPAGLIKPTCSKMFKQSSNCEATSSVAPGSAAAYLLMRAQQQANLVAPTMENDPELDQEMIAEEEIETVRAPRKSRGRSKMSKVHARAPEERVVINLNEEGQVISDDQNELTNFLGTLAKDNVSLTYINWHVVPDELKKQMWEYTLARYVIPDEGHKWVMRTLNDAWKQYKCRFKAAHYKKYSNDQERMENRPESVPLEDFKVLLAYWGDESVQALAEDNAARRKTLSEIHTMGPKTHAQAKEKMKKDSNLAKPSDAEIYLETYKRKPGRTYKTNTDEVKYANVQALVDAGKIAEANALVAGGKTHGRNWLVGRQGKKGVKTSTPAPTENYVQELTTKIRQDLEVDLEAKVNQKVQENMSLLMKKLREANPDLNFDIGPLTDTPSSGQDDNGTPTTHGGTEI